MEKVVVEQMMEKQGVTEQLKAENQMFWLCERSLNFRMSILCEKKLHKKYFFDIIMIRKEEK